MYSIIPVWRVWCDSLLWRHTLTSVIKSGYIPLPVHPLHYVPIGVTPPWTPPRGHYPNPLPAQSLPSMSVLWVCFEHLNLKSSFPKPDKSTFDENRVFNIIVQNYMRAIVTEWILDPDNSRKYIFFLPIDMCINSVKETCFSQKYQKWIYLILEINSSFVGAQTFRTIKHFQNVYDLLQ